MKLRNLATTLLGLLALPTLAAADEIDDAIEGGPDQSGSVRSEKAALQNEVAVQTADEDRRRRIIKTLQQKEFMKIGRYEVSPQIGFVTNDPFINRYLAGVGLTYHVTEVFGVEFNGTVSPLGNQKPITQQIIEENNVTPDISEIQWFGSMTFDYSPIYGKVAVGQQIIMFDLFGAFGGGVVNTRDDLEALSKTTDADALATESQLHPSLNYGGGLRVVFSKAFALRLEGRGLSFIEVVESDNLEMKNNFMLLTGASIFFGGKAE